MFVILRVHQKPASEEFTPFEDRGTVGEYHAVT
jgi:hypothetical protein